MPGKFLGQFMDHYALYLNAMPRSISGQDAVAAFQRRTPVGAMVPVVLMRAIKSPECDSLEEERAVEAWNDIGE